MSLINWFEINVQKMLVLTIICKYACVWMSLNATDFPLPSQVSLFISWFAKLDFKTLVSVTVDKVALVTLSTRWHQYQFHKAILSTS